MNKRGNIFLIIGVVIAIILIGGTALVSSQPKKSSSNQNLIEKITNPYNIPESEDEIVKECAGYLPHKVAKCLTLQIETFYKYNPTKDNVYLSLDELKEKGGDCKSWSELYQRLALRIGLKTEIVKIPMASPNVQNHIVLFVWNHGQGEYCLIDHTRAGKKFYCGVENE